MKTNDILAIINVVVSHGPVSIANQRFEGRVEERWNSTDHYRHLDCEVYFCR